RPPTSSAPDPLTIDHSGILIVAALLAATIVSPSRAEAQEPLEVLGFRPGASHAAAEAAVRSQRGRWNCRQSAVDPRFTECLGSIAPAGEPALDLIASLVRDSVAVLLLSGTVTDVDLRRWRARLDARIGPATERHSQGQVVWQWVRSGRMIRITSRAEGGTQRASVSLVDGWLLDGLGEPGPGR
ncbi:MAG TPA: hypothetical protein VF862_14315, partial [Gemmatimonadales bacterium]